MKKTTLAPILISILFSSLALGVHIIDLAKANPISIPQVPAIEIGYPLTSTGRYVNSTVEFAITVNMFVESPTINSISYSLDGEAPVKVEEQKSPTLTIMA